MIEEQNFVAFEEVQTIHGYSPTVEVVEEKDNVILNIKDIDGTKQAVIPKGYVPVKGVDYFDGEKGEQGIQGRQGEKGEPFTYDDFTPEQLAALKGNQGDPGHSPVKGVDYFTEADKQAMVQEVLNSLPDGDGVEY